jgi:hypothetical protein
VSDYSCAVVADARWNARAAAGTARRGLGVVAVSVLLVLALVAACAPQKHREVDDWDRELVMEPEITGDNAKDEARWRRELAGDPWDDDDRLLTDDFPGTASEYANDDIPPLDFVGPPEPPSTWDNMQSGGGKVGKVIFSLLTVFVTLGMMAAPYLLMI